MLGVVFEESGHSFVDGGSDALSSWQCASDLAVSDDEDVSDSGVVDVASFVLEGNDRDVSELLDDRLDGADSAQVVTASDEGFMSDRKGEVLLDGLGVEVVEDRVTNLDGRVRVSDGSGVVGHHVGDLVGADLDSDDLAELSDQLLVGALVGDLQQGEPSPLVVEQSELVSGLGDFDDVCGQPNLPISPTGNLWSLLTFPSILTSLSFSLRMRVFSL